MRRWLLLLSLTAMLAGCASAPPKPPAPEGLFRDELFAAPSERISVDDVFALSDAMRHYLNVDIAAQLRTEGLQQGLIDALRNRGQLRIDYDSTMTRNAAQAFEARSGNCLSLLIMTAAFAKELGLPVTYQSVIIDETWSRSGDIYFASGHVNLMLGKRITDLRAGYDSSRLLTIDFLAAEDILGQRTKVIDEATVVAMYFNNRAAENLARDRLDDAYAWARAGIRHNPGFVSAYNTLGVIYQRHGNSPEAEVVLRYALEREPRNTQVIANLAQLLGNLGRTEEAQQMQRRLAQLEQDPPFYFFKLGMAAMREGNYKAARDLFALEVERAPDYHEFHFWLGVASYRLGDIAAARKHLALALDDSTTVSDRDLYAAKLAWLKSHQKP
ncbi:MAG TPA: tetratricopeptide repeat protein [Methylibium sp.]